MAKPTKAERQLIGHIDGVNAALARYNDAREDYIRCLEDVRRYVRTEITHLLAGFHDESSVAESLRMALEAHDELRASDRALTAAQEGQKTPN